MSHECTNGYLPVAVLRRAWRSVGQVVKKAAVALVAVAATATAVHAETLLMPNRDYLMGTSEVVWGISTLPNGTAFTLDYGDGSPRRPATSPTGPTSPSTTRTGSAASSPSR